MKIMTSIFVLIFMAALFIFWASRPALSEKEFPSQGVIQLPESGKTRSYSSAITLLTYNIGYASGAKNNKGSILSRQEVVENLNQIAQTLTTINADVVALQEVDFAATRTFSINQLDFLQKKTGYPYSAYVVLWNKKYLPWPYWPPSLHFGKIVSGQVVLSFYPIESQKITFFEKPKNNSFWYNWFYVDRAEQAVTLKMENQKGVIWNVHLEAFDEETRNKQIGILAGLVDREMADIKFVLGDFNTPSLEVFLSGTGFQTAESVLLSMPSWAPVEKIDHVLYRLPYHPTGTGTLSKATASDHLPIWGNFE